MKDNAAGMKGIAKKYHSDVPEFLHYRPPYFINHCMEKIEHGMVIRREDIDKLSPNEYTVCVATNVKSLKLNQN